MPERRFDTGYWNAPDIIDLPMKAKLLYLYLWTNRHCNQAGLYEIALKTISFETGMAIEELPELLKILEKKVTWVPKQNLIWVKNFLRHQSKSPQFLAAAAKCLENINNNGLVKEYVDYNLGYRLSIPYQEGIDRVSIPPYSYALSGSGKGDIKGGYGGEKKGENKGSASQPKKSASVVNEIFAEMRRFLGYPEDKVCGPGSPTPGEKKEAKVCGGEAVPALEESPAGDARSKREKGAIDPIPNYGKEGKAIKRMLTRGFTREEILACWKGKVSQRGGEFISMTWVNEDIGQTGKQKRMPRELSTAEEIAKSIKEAGK